MSDPAIRYRDMNGGPRESSESERSSIGEQPAAPIDVPSPGNSSSSSDSEAEARASPELEQNQQEIFVVQNEEENRGDDGEAPEPENEEEIEEEKQLGPEAQQEAQQSRSHSPESMSSLSRSSDGTPGIVGINSPVVGIAQRMIGVAAGLPVPRRPERASSSSTASSRLASSRPARPTTLSTRTHYRKLPSQKVKTPEREASSSSREGSVIPESPHPSPPQSPAKRKMSRALAANKSPKMPRPVDTSEPSIGERLRGQRANGERKVHVDRYQAQPFKRPKRVARQQKKFKIVKVLEHEFMRGKHYYLVEWATGAQSWQLNKDLDSAPTLVREFWEKTHEAKLASAGKKPSRRAPDVRRRAVSLSRATSQTSCAQTKIRKTHNLRRRSVRDIKK